MGDVQFRRIGGRIVPIRRNNNKQAAGLGVVAAGAAAIIAAKPHERSVTIDGTSVIHRRSIGLQGLNHKFLVKSQNHGVLAETIVRKNVFGRFNIDWIHVNEKFRGRGLSEQVSRISASYMKSQGAKSAQSIVVSPSAAEALRRKSTTKFFTLNIKAKTLKDFRKPLSSTAAIRNIKKNKLVMANTLLPKNTFQWKAMPMTKSSKGLLAAGFVGLLGGAWLSRGEK